jgi:hypothetical protein
MYTIIIIKICVIVSMVLFIRSAVKEINHSRKILLCKEINKTINYIEQQSIFTVVNIFAWLCLSVFFSSLLIILEY